MSQQTPFCWFHAHQTTFFFFIIIRPSILYSLEGYWPTNISINHINILIYYTISLCELNWCSDSHLGFSLIWLMWIIYPACDYMRNYWQHHVLDHFDPTNLLLPLPTCYPHPGLTLADLFQLTLINPFFPWVFKIQIPINVVFNSSKSVFCWIIQRKGS